MDQAKYEARELAPDEASQGPENSAADGSRRPGNPLFYFLSTRHWNSPALLALGASVT